MLTSGIIWAWLLAEAASPLLGHTVQQQTWEFSRLVVLTPTEGLAAGGCGQDEDTDAASVISDKLMPLTSPQETQRQVPRRTPDREM